MVGFLEPFLEPGVWGPVEGTSFETEKTRRVMDCVIVLLSTSFVLIGRWGKRRERSEGGLSLWVLTAYLWHMTQVMSKALIFSPDISVFIVQLGSGFQDLPVEVRSASCSRK